MSEKPVNYLEDKYFDRYKKLIHTDTKPKSTELYHSKVAQFQLECSKLFHIASCKCINEEGCRFTPDKRVRKHERQCLKDQRTEIKMIIGAVKEAVSKKNKR